MVYAWSSSRPSQPATHGHTPAHALEEAFAAAGAELKLIHVRTCRRFLGVRGDTPDELLKLQVLDSRIGLNVWV